MKIYLTNPLFATRKALMIFGMRIILLLCCTTVLGFSPTNALSQNTKVKIASYQEASIDEVFDLIMDQTDFTFIYQVDLFKNHPKVLLEKGKIKVNELLQKSLQNRRYDVVFNNNNNIVISTKSTVQQSISGRVTDENNNPLPGVTVLIKGTTVGVTSDFDGNYTLTASTGDILSFSYLGKQTLEIGVGNDSTINAILLDESEELQEVVLVGYGTQTRDEVSSAIATIKSKDVVTNVVGQLSFDRALEGLAKGLRITSISGAPGTGVDINIRGIISPFAGGNNNPLFVIDGVPFNNSTSATFRGRSQFAQTPNPLLVLDPNDIESVDILKDAGATAIYGSRGANGVIIVKTKRGRKNQKAKVSFGITTSFAKPIGTVDYLDTAEDYKTYQDEVLRNTIEFTNVNAAYASNVSVNNFSHNALFTIDNNTSLVTYQGLNEDYYGTSNTNWNDEIYRDSAFRVKYNLSVDGGGEKTSYSFGGNFSDQQGLIEEEIYQQYNFKASIDSKINSVFSLGSTLNYGYLKTDAGDSPIRYRALNGNFSNNSRPDIEARDENGNLNRIPDLYRRTIMKSSPLAQSTANIYNGATKNLLGNIYIEARLIKNLLLRYDFNAAEFTNNSYFYLSRASQTLGGFSSFDGAGTLDQVVESNVVSNFTLKYNHSIDQHSFAGLAGVAFDRSRSSRSTFQGQGFPDDLILNTLGNATRISVYDQATVDTGLNSLFGRLSYDYAKKYYLTINLRADNSIKFAPNNRRAFFPSIAASWNIAKENFLVNSTTVNDLRLRASIGQTGSTNLGDFAYQQFFNANGIIYNGSTGTALLGELPNPEIKWETTKEINIGLDFSFLNQRLRGSFDLYDKKTTDALTPFVLPLETGASSYVANFASLTNKGFELEIGGDPIKTEDFNWSLDFRIAQNKNTLDKFNVEGIDPFALDFYEVGQPVNIIRGYIVEGIFQNQQEIDELNAAAPDGFYQETQTGAGDYKYRDLNGDNEITLDDREILGSAQEDFFGSINTNFSHKNWQLSALFNFSKGAESRLRTDIFDFGQFSDANSTRRLFNNRWTPTNTDAEYARAILNDPNQNRRNSDRLTYDTSYIRLRQLQLGYTFSGQLLEQLNLLEANLFVAGSNLWTKTNHPGIDPAARSAGLAVNESFVNDEPYPIAKSWSLGFNIKF